MKLAVQNVNGLNSAVIAFALKIEESFSSVVIILNKNKKNEIFLSIFCSSGKLKMVQE